MNKIKLLLVSIAVAGAGAAGMEFASQYDISPSKVLAKSTRVRWDNTVKSAWPSYFAKVTLDSGQNAYLYTSPVEGAPLVISLHTWSGGFDQHDPFAEKAVEMGWNYIHPHFQGSNDRPQACLSDQVIEDIDEAITYAISTTAADEKNVFVVGASGGGYAALGYYLQADSRIKKILSWVPISDLEQWYFQSLRQNLRYSDDILACTASADKVLDIQSARERSPLHWDIPDAEMPILHIYAGINDGYDGSVPVSHSLLFYNKVVTHLSNGTAKTVSPAETAAILSRGITSDRSKETQDGRSILYRADYPGVSLTIFEGGHEMLIDHSAKKLAVTASWATSF